MNLWKAAPCLCDLTPAVGRRVSRISPREITATSLNGVWLVDRSVRTGIVTTSIPEEASVVMPSVNAGRCCPFRFTAEACLHRGRAEQAERGLSLEWVGSGV
jgi:hypothetical protein